MDKWPQPDDLDNEAFHTNVLAPLVNQLVQDFKVIMGNALIAAPNDENFNFGTAPDKDAVTYIQTALEKAGLYLALFPEYAVTLKKDIKPLARAQRLFSVILI